MSVLVVGAFKIRRVEQGCLAELWRRGCTSQERLKEKLKDPGMEVAATVVAYENGREFILRVIRVGAPFMLATLK